jgi:hypothetical protein
MGGKSVNKSRRRFLIAATGGAAALVVGVYLGTSGEKAAPPARRGGMIPAAGCPTPG